MWNLDYKELYQFSLDYPEIYWDEVAKDVTWSKPYMSVLENRNTNNPQWYVGGEINMSYNCLDRQVEEGYGDDVAVIHDSPITGSIQRLTYNDLLKTVQLLAGVMTQRCGIRKGDRVLLYFPMIPQCLIAMLACTRIGAISTTIFGGFAVKEFALRIKYFEPKLIISSNVGLEPGEVINYKERIDSAILLSGYAPNFHIVYNRPNYIKATLTPGIDLEWDEEINNATPQGVTPVESDHPQYAIFTSGTTGEPKCIVKQTGGSVVSNKYVMKRFIGLKPGEVWWAMSNFAWIIGQTDLSYGPLMSRNPTIIFEGKVIDSPESSQFARILNTHKVSSLISVPTVMKTLRKFCSESDLKLTYSDLRAIILVGELTDQTINEWTSCTFNCNVYTRWSQTELSAGGVSPGLGFKGSEKYRHDNIMGLVMPSYQFKIVDRHTGTALPNDTIGRILLKMPINPASVFTLFRDEARYLRTYMTKYPGYYDTMDAGLMTNEGHVRIVARDDDIIHVGGVRICGGAVEEACMRLESVIDAAVVAMEDPIRGHVPFAFLVSNGEISDKEIVEKSINNVLTCIGVVAHFSRAVIVPGLPRTKSGKKIRFSLADMVNGKSFKMPVTIDNPEIYSYIHDILLKEGYNPSLPSEM